MTRGGRRTALGRGASVGIGDPAPLTELVDAGGRRTTLAAFRGEATLLIFMRHLG